MRVTFHRLVLWALMKEIILMVVYLVLKKEIVFM
jgi:hypothetical protein